MQRCFRAECLFCVPGWRADLKLSSPRYWVAANIKPSARALGVIEMTKGLEHRLLFTDPEPYSHSHKTPFQLLLPFDSVSAPHRAPSFILHSHYDATRSGIHFTRYRVGPLTVFLAAAITPIRTTHNRPSARQPPEHCPSLLPCPHIRHGHNSEESRWCLGRGYRRLRGASRTCRRASRSGGSGGRAQTSLRCIVGLAGRDVE